MFGFGFGLVANFGLESRLDSGEPRAKLDEEASGRLDQTGFSESADSPCEHDFIICEIWIVWIGDRE